MTKKRATSWFAKLPNTELAQLCSVLNLTKSGTKEHLVARLLTHDEARKYGQEEKREKRQRVIALLKS